MKGAIPTATEVNGPRMRLRNCVSSRSGRHSQQEVAEANLTGSTETSANSLALEMQKSRRM
eukprot:5218196-Karenia_brevis.AAC.1